MKTMWMLGLMCGLCVATAASAADVALGTWSGDLPYLTFLARDPASGGTGTPIAEIAGSVDLFADHIYLAKYSFPGYDWVGYRFKADAPIIDSVTLGLDQYVWKPEGATSNNTLFINVNGTVTHRVELPPGNDVTSNVADQTLTFDPPTDTVFVYIQRYLRWGGDNQGTLEIYEGPGTGSTPWVFHSVLREIVGRIAPASYLPTDLGNMGVKIELIQNGTVIRTVNTLTSELGTFSVGNVSAGMYDITVQVPFCLKRVFKGFHVVDNPSDLGTIDLLPGDSNGDDQVSFEDFSILQNSYGQRGETVANPLAAAAMGGCTPIGLLLISILALALRCRD